MKKRYLITGAFGAVAAAAAGGALLGNAVGQDVRHALAQAKRDAAVAPAQPAAYKNTGTRARQEYKSRRRISHE